MRWLPSAQRRSNSGSISPSGSTHNNLTANFQTIILEETTADESPTQPNGGDATKSSI